MLGRHEPLTGGRVKGAQQRVELREQADADMGSRWRRIRQGPIGQLVRSDVLVEGPCGAGQRPVDRGQAEAAEPGDVVA